VLYASVASGEVEIGFNQISEILAQPTVELAGPLPSAIQNYTQFAPGIVTGSSQTDLPPYFEQATPCKSLGSLMV
jgi:molybdate transport system substrate-binding protein